MSTFLLIHGAFQGGWIWKLVGDRLREAGHTVYAPTLDGCGERSYQLRPGITTETQAEEVAGFLWSEDLRDVVMVGTSAGGMVAAKTAELAADRISRIVFSDALTLVHGECIRDIGSGGQQIETNLAVGPEKEGRFERFRQDMDDGLARWAADRSTLHPKGCFVEPVALQNFWNLDWDATVVYCKQAEKPGKTHQRRCADNLGAKWHILDTGHYAMLREPDAITEIILAG